MSKLPLRLKELRLKKGLRQKDMSIKLGITESAYGYYEQGRNEPPTETLVILSDIFGVTIDYLLGRVDNPNKTKEDLETILKEIPDLRSNIYNHDLAMEKIKEALKIKRLTYKGKPIEEGKAKMLIASLEAQLEALE